MSRSGLVLTLVLVLAAPAAADESLHATLALTSGYTDNVLNTPVNPTNFLSAQPQVGDSFAAVSPGLYFTHESQRIVESGRYDFNARLFADRTEANSYSNNLAYGFLYALSPVSELGLAASLANGRSNAFVQNPQDQMVDARLNGDISFATAGLSLSYSRALGRDWNVRATSGWSGFRPVDDTARVGPSHQLQNIASLERTWGWDALTASFRLNYSGVQRVADSGPLPPDEQMQLGPEVRWVHDLSPKWSTDATAGLLMSLRFPDFKRGSLVPSTSAFVHYLFDRATASVGVRHGANTNIFVATTTVATVVEGRLVIPIPYVTGWTIAGSLGYGTGRFLNLETQSLVGRNEQLVFDALLGWKISDELQLGFRYQDQRQILDFPPNVVRELTRRKTFLLSLSGRYPSREAARLPDRQALRADQSDEEDFGQRQDAHVSRR